MWVRPSWDVCTGGHAHAATVFQGRVFMELLFCAQQCFSVWE